MEICHRKVEYLELYRQYSLLFLVYLISTSRSLAVLILELITPGPDWRARDGIILSICQSVLLCRIMKLTKVLWPSDP
jgi:hypothetical protein